VSIPFLFGSIVRLCCYVQYALSVTERQRSVRQRSRELLQHPGQLLWRRPRARETAIKGAALPDVHNVHTRLNDRGKILTLPAPLAPPSQELVEWVFYDPDLAPNQLAIAALEACNIPPGMSVTCARGRHRAPDYGTLCGVRASYSCLTAFYEYAV